MILKIYLPKLVYFAYLTLNFKVKIYTTPRIKIHFSASKLGEVTHQVFTGK